MKDQLRILEINVSIVCAREARHRKRMELRVLEGKQRLREEQSKIYVVNANASRNFNIFNHITS